MKTSDKKTAIVAALKAAGYNSKAVSVRVRHCGYSSEIIATAYDPAIKLHVVEEIVGQFEKIHYCEVSQEILSGGNTFVDVRYSDAAREKISNCFYAEINPEEVQEGDQFNVGPWLFMRNRSGWDVWFQGGHDNSYSFMWTVRVNADGKLGKYNAFIMKMHEQRENA